LANKIVPIKNPADLTPIRELAEPLPFNPEAERGILGAIVLDNGLLGEAVEKLETRDFFLRQHQLIFLAMSHLDAVDYVTLVDELTRRDQLEAVGGPAYVSSLADGLPRTRNLGQYIRIVKHKAALRRMISLGQKFQEVGFGKDLSSVEDLRRQSVELFEDIYPEEAKPADTLTVADMPSSVLDGRLGEICENRLGGLPRAYAWPSILCVAGTLTPVSDTRTNLYVAVIGPVGSGKTQVIERSVLAMGLGEPFLENTLAGSFEGLSERLDVNGEARLLSPDELAHLLLKAQIDRASFPFTLNTSYYRTEFDVTAQRGKQIHVNARLGIIGGIVEDRFSESFGSATTGGLHDRFVFGRCPSPYEFRYRPFEGGPEHTEPCSVSIAPDVWELRDSWLKDIPGLSPRCAENAIRAATIAASFSGRSILYARGIESSARAFVEYQHRMRQAFQPNPGENTDAKAAFAILAMLNDKPGWHLRRDVAKHIHYERYGPSAFERALNSLVAAGDIDLDTKKRPARLRRVGQ
jgi:hypothetical protein